MHGHFNKTIKKDQKVDHKTSNHGPKTDIWHLTKIDIPLRRLCSSCTRRRNTNQILWMLCSGCQRKALLSNVSLIYSNLQLRHCIFWRKDIKMKKKIRNKTSLVFLLLVSFCFPTHNDVYEQNINRSDWTSAQGPTAVKNGQHR